MPCAEANCCPFSARGSCSAQSRRLLLQCPVDREAPRAGLRSRLKCEKSSNFPKSGICPKPPHITRSCSSRLLRLARRPARAGRLPATARRHPKCEWHVRRGHSHLLTSHSEQASRLLVSHLTLATAVTGRRASTSSFSNVGFVVQPRRLRRSPPPPPPRPLPMPPMPGNPPMPGMPGMPPPPIPPIPPIIL